MTNAATNQPLITRWWVRLLIIVVGMLVLLLVGTSVKVIETASRQEVHPADAIVVFGAAEYAGRPSPGTARRAWITLLLCSSAEPRR